MSTFIFYQKCKSGVAPQCTVCMLVKMLTIYGYLLSHNSMFEHSGETYNDLYLESISNHTIILVKIIFIKYWDIYCQLLTFLKYCLVYIYNYLFLLQSYIKSKQVQKYNSPVSILLWRVGTGVNFESWGGVSDAGKFGPDIFPRMGNLTRYPCPRVGNLTPFPRVGNLTQCPCPRVANPKFNVGRFWPYITTLGRWFWCIWGSKLTLSPSSTMMTKYWQAYNVHIILVTNQKSLPNSGGWDVHFDENSEKISTCIFNI